jgi:hypothetical protein
VAAAQPVREQPPVHEQRVPAQRSGRSTCGPSRIGVTNVVRTVGTRPRSRMLQKSRRSTTLGSLENPGGAPDFDQVRVGSMADEGGASGATMDAREQHASSHLEIRDRRSWPMWLAIGVAAGFAALAGAWFGRSRSVRGWLRRRF